MKNLEKYYLCGIGQINEIERFEVGIYDKDRESFKFNNGLNELYKEPRGSNTAYVISAISLEELDNNELLTKYKNKV